MPPENSTFNPAENILIGNVALYGATSGKAYFDGIAGERFCVRNSGATAIVEGCGDHGLEYMTGVAVIRGRTGRNRAAGMSGGIAYVLDEDHTLYQRLNSSLVTMHEVKERYDIQELKALISDYAEETGSVKARKILADFENYIPKFKKLVPDDYQTILSITGKFEEQGIPHQSALLEAFYELKQKEAQKNG